LQHVLIGVALLSFLFLDLIFVSYSSSPSAALVFALLSYTILLVLSAAAGNLAGQTDDYENPLESQGVPGPVRPILAAVIPVALLLILAFLREMDSLIDPKEAVGLGSTFAVFWLLAALTLAGAVLGFIRPRTGALEAVIAGGLVVLAQSLLSRVALEAGRESLQLALYTWMIWITVCLAGAWMGMVLRQTVEHMWNEDEASTSTPPGVANGGGEFEEGVDDPGALASPQGPPLTDPPGETGPANPE